MKKLLLIAGILLTCLAALPAADHPMFDFYAGYTFQRFNDEVTVPAFKANMPWGFGLSACGYAHKNVGVLVDFSYSKKNFDENEAFSAYYVLVGPQFTARHERFSPFVRGFVGWAHNRASNAVASAAMTKFCYGFGGGLDIRCNDLVSVRAVQFDYIRQTDLLEANVFRFGFGVVFHGGKR